MSSIRQKIYWKAPYLVKNLMASINAMILDRERHGPAFEQALAEIAEHDKWSAEQFRQYQCVQLQSLIRHVSEKVPYYQKMFAEKGINPESITKPQDLQRLPILEKTVARSDPMSLLDRTLDRRKLIVEHTSGTTGTPINLYRDVWLNSVVYAYSDARCYAVVGMHRRFNRSVTSFGHPVAAPNRNKPPFWVYNRRWKQLYMSSYHLAPDYLKYYVEELRKFKADYIEAIPSTAYAIARYILDNKLEPVPFKACFTTAETLFDYQREAVKKAFGCRTYDQYGCGEMAISAAECPYGSMHLSPEIGIVEVVDDKDRPLPVGQMGQLICTSLINRVQPFIRYRLGDVGALKAGKCSCGSPLPMLSSIEGRVDDVLITRDGRRIGRLDPVFKKARGIIEAQIVQDDYDKFRVRVVPSKTYKEDDGREIQASLLERVGEGSVVIELVDKIERTSGGKFKAVVRNMSE